MKNIGLSLNIKNLIGKGRPLMNGSKGSEDFQVGLNEAGQVTLILDGTEFTKETLGGGTNPEGGSGSSTGGSLIVIAKNVALTYNNDSEEDESNHFFLSDNLAANLFPADYISAPFKYNLVVVVHGTDEDGNVCGYTANHFCYEFFSEGFTTAQCYDSVGENDITHLTVLQRETADQPFTIQYQGFMSGSSRVLPKEGSTVDVYLQKF